MNHEDKNEDMWRIFLENRENQVNWFWLGAISKTSPWVSPWGYDTKHLGAQEGNVIFWEMGKVYVDG